MKKKQKGVLLMKYRVYVFEYMFIQLIMPFDTAI